MTRVAAIGLDSAEITLIDSLIAEGRMPNLARLRERSIRWPLRNDEAKTGLVWQGFLIGKPPTPSPIRFDPESYDTWNQTVSPEPSFLEGLPGTRTIAFDVPQMTLPRNAEGIFVTAWGAHAAGYPRASQPQGLLTEIDRSFGAHPAFRDDEAAWNDARSIADLRDRLVRGARLRSSICAWLMERMPDWELFFTVFSESHSAGEAFWHGHDQRHPLHTLPQARDAQAALRAVYEAIDASVGEVVAALPDDCVTIVFSLHGITLNSGDLPGEVLLPEFVHRAQGGAPYLTYGDTEGWSRAGHPFVVPPPGTWGRAVERPRDASRPAGRAKEIARRLLPVGVKKALVDLRRKAVQSEGDIAGDSETHLTAAEIGTPAVHIDYQPASWYREWWPHMRYFALPTFADGRIRVNLKGRERNGVVDPLDYESTLTEIEGLLHSITDPRTGRPAVKEVIRNGGPDGRIGDHDCDLLVVWHDGVDALHHPATGTVGPARFLRTGGHNENAFAWIAGLDGHHDLPPGSAADLRKSFLDLVVNGSAPLLEQGVHLS